MIDSKGDRGFIDRVSEIKYVIRSFFKAVRRLECRRPVDPHSFRDLDETLAAPARAAHATKGRARTNLGCIG
ncbi:hypothetical protein [Caballeronia hypogeia]|uniref:hypothetical protein n=1 Tax=Caballeronia hypogeia TaxID=1777140 RepID=UPI0012FD10CE|nr:hypothetical protein [Caballeronia hypogeia]